MRDIETDIRKRLQTLLEDVHGGHREFLCSEDPKALFDPSRYQLFCRLMASEFDLDDEGLVVDTTGIGSILQALLDRCPKLFSSRR